MVTDEEASEKLTKVLNSVKTPHGTVDNVMRVHSLRPSTMKAITNYISLSFTMKKISYQLGFKKLLVVMFL